MSNSTKWADSTMLALHLTALEGYPVASYIIDLTRVHKLNPVNNAEESWVSNAQHWPRCTTP